MAKSAGLICGLFGIEMLENVGHFRAVRRAVTGARRVCRIIRVLVEVVIENLGPAGLRLEPRPNPRVPAEGRVTGQVARGFGNRVGADGIGFDQIVGELAVTRCDVGDVILRRSWRRKTRAFVGVVADENRACRCICRPRRVCIGRRESPSRQQSARTSRRRGPTGSLSGAIFRNSAMDETPAALGVSFAGALGIGEAFHVFAGRVACGCGGPNEPPLSEMAPWKSPLASGDAHNMLTAMPPADSPKIVTFFGSPPNAAIFFFTHWRPAIWSSRP